MAATLDVARRVVAGRKRCTEEATLTASAPAEPHGLPGDAADPSFRRVIVGVPLCVTGAEFRIPAVLLDERSRPQEEINPQLRFDKDTVCST